MQVAISKSEVKINPVTVSFHCDTIEDLQKWHMIFNCAIGDFFVEDFEEKQKLKNILVDSNDNKPVYHHKIHQDILKKFKDIIKTVL